MNSHKKRILTTLVVLPVVAWIILFGSNFFLQILIFCVSGLALFEFLSLFWGNNHFNLKITSILLALPMVFSNFIHVSVEFLLVSSFWILNLFFLYSYGIGRTYDENGIDKGKSTDTQSHPRSISWMDIQLIFLGIVYIPYILQFFNSVPRKEIVFILGIAIISDTCAYYSGRLFGKRKLWPRVSPKKTWMGSFGSLLGCLLFSFIYGEIFFSMSWYQILILGTLLNLGAQLGDLFESALKRYLKIKDSGFILPGHGGILDRIDSLLFVCPIYLIFSKYFLTV
ncbi:phosphatidate cytidylyltransferase [Desulfothermus okinawensis]